MDIRYEDVECAKRNTGADAPVFPVRSLLNLYHVQNRRCSLIIFNDKEVVAGRG